MVPTTHVSSRTHVSHVCTRFPSIHPHPSRAPLPSVPSFDTSTIATPFRTHFSAVLRMAAAGPRTRPTEFPCGMQVRLRSQWVPRVRLVSQTSRGKRRSGARPRSKRRKRTRWTMRTCHASSTPTRQMHPIRSRCTLARREGTRMGNGAPLETGEDAPPRMERRRRVWWRGGVDLRGISLGSGAGRIDTLRVERSRSRSGDGSRRLDLFPWPGRSFSTA